MTYESQNRGLSFTVQPSIFGSTPIRRSQEILVVKLISLDSTNEFPVVPDIAEPSRKFSSEHKCLNLKLLSLESFSLNDQNFSNSRQRRESTAVKVFQNSFSLAW